MRLREHLRSFRTAWAKSAGELSDRQSKKRAVWYLLLLDHGILRSVWRNLSQIAPGVFRANQPSPEMLIRYKRKGIRSVVNLRGASDNPPYLLEKLQCGVLGLVLHNVQGLAARRAPSRKALVSALDTLRAAEKPVLFHCKSGADRTSLVAAIYLIAECGASIAQARKQFSPWFIHFKWTKSGVLDHVLDMYESAHAADGIGFEEWLRTAYNKADVQSSFEASRS